MNNTEEVRLCKKCGKRLPSSNNFCMYCVVITTLLMKN